MSILGTSPRRRSLRRFPKPTTYSAIPRNAKFTIRLGSTQTTLIPRPRRLMRGREAVLEAREQPADFLADSRAAERRMAAKAFLSILAASIFPTSSTARGEDEGAAVVAASATSSVRSSAEGEERLPQKKALNPGPISNIKTTFLSGRRSAAGGCVW